MLWVVVNRTSAISGVPIAVLMVFQSSRGVMSEGISDPSLSIKSVRSRLVGPTGGGVVVALVLGGAGCFLPATLAQVVVSCGLRGSAGGGG